jgi:hypothetical protein
MKKCLFVFYFLLLNTIVFSQNILKFENDFWLGKAIYQNGNKISVNDAKEIAKNNLEIVEKLSSAQSNRTWGAIFGYPGSIAFGYTLGSSINKNIKTNWTVGIIGAGMMITGIILQGKGNKQLKEAVDDYNLSMSKSTAFFRPELHLTTSENGVGFAMTF